MLKKLFELAVKEHGEYGEEVIVISHEIFEGAKQEFAQHNEKKSIVSNKKYCKKCKKEIEENHWWQRSGKRGWEHCNCDDPTNSESRPVPRAADGLESRRLTQPTELSSDDKDSSPSSARR